MSLRASPLVTLLVLLLSGGAHAEPAAAPTRIGAPVPDFTATSIDGRPVSLAAAMSAHKAVVVVFLSTVCPYANRFAPHLRELEEAYGPRGVLLVGINSNKWESREDVAANARERGFTFPIVKDEHHQISDALGVTRTPEALVIDAKGRLRYRGWVKSRQESPDLQRALDAVLQGRRVAKPLTKAFGCAVDRS